MLSIERRRGNMLLLPNLSSFYMSRFSHYLSQTFHFSEPEAEEIIAAMKQPLGKSIRVNTRKISRENFIQHAQEQNWILTETGIPEVFTIDRTDTSIALGNTLEHQMGWFYIQEVAAAHPPHLLREKIREQQKEDNTSIILDMCAAPGWKTTQLADYFPEAQIIANEVNRSRTPQLFENLDRMGYDNIAVVSCDGRFFQKFPDFFDAVLLDAPCSGEGTAFRDGSVIDHWHEKNITRIAKLQAQLFATAKNILRPGWFLSYSTCTLNMLENEWIIDESEGFLELFRKRFWPHIEKTWGFFASIFQKKNIDSEKVSYPVLAAEWQKHRIVRPVTKWEREMVERFIHKYFHTSLQDGFLSISKGNIYFHRKNLTSLWEYFFFVHAWAKIGSIERNTFTPYHHLWWYLRDVSKIETFTLPFPYGQKDVSCETDNEYIALQYGRWVLGIFSVKWGKIQIQC